MGDFNFDSKIENDKIPSNFQDVWIILKNNNEESFTMKKSKRFRAWRPDRICLKKDCNWKPKSIERIGMEPLPLYEHKIS